MFGRNNQEFIGVRGYRINTNDISYYYGIKDDTPNSKKCLLVIVLKSNGNDIKLDFEEENNVQEILSYLDSILLNNSIPYRMPDSYTGTSREELEREIDSGLEDIWNFSNKHFNPNNRGFRSFDDSNPGKNYGSYKRASNQKTTVESVFNKETPFAKEIKK